MKINEWVETTQRWKVYKFITKYHFEDDTKKISGDSKGATYTKTKVF